MTGELINIGLAFIEGIALIISPCILPILPIILSGSLTGSRKRPFGIIVGFVSTFALVTLFSRAVINAAHISPDLLRNISFSILLVLGLMMMSSYLTETFARWTRRFAVIGASGSTVNGQESGFWGGVLFGSLVGVIWTPCAGPILAAAVVQVILQQSTLGGAFIVLAFGIGSGLPMLLIALFGRSVLLYLPFVGKHTEVLRKVLGLIIVISVVVFMWSPATWVRSSAQCSVTKSVATHLINPVPIPYHAPAIAGITAWINSKPVSLNDLEGKVVLVDFWTYSCINCLRTIPHLNEWYAKYHDKGLVIIGVHSPEFEFEKNLDDVKSAVVANDIQYPVALDNDFTTWQNYQNQYWPAEYLIDKDGRVVTETFGEGDFTVTENNIRYLLGLNEPVVMSHREAPQVGHQTPETYLGYARADNFQSMQTIVKDKPNTFTFPPALLTDQWALSGTWMVYADRVVSVSAGASIKLHYAAAKVYAVMGALYQTVKLKVSINGQDVADSPLDVDPHKLYTLVDGAHFTDDTIELVAENPGLEVYTFTFGGS